MLIKKTISDDSIRCVYESSNILVSEYSKDNKDLIIIFKNGGKYSYKNVGLTDYTRFETADSQGKVLNSHIKAYPFTNLGKVNVDLIKEEILEIAKENLLEYTISIKKKALDLISDIDNNVDIADKKINEMKTILDEYSNKKDV